MNDSTEDVEQPEPDESETFEETGEAVISDAVSPGQNAPASESLEEALTRAELDIPREFWERINQYRTELWSWNERLNLTRHTTFDLFVRRDLVDSWQLAKLLKPDEEVIDLGTGGGVPGILIAILRPDIQVSLCDSVQKKAKAVDSIVRKLKLPVPVHPHRIQDLLKDFRYSSILARAVGPLDKLCFWLKDDWHSFDRLLAIKGPKWVEERGNARHRGLLNQIELRKLASYPLYGTPSESVILQLRRPRPGETVAPE